VNTRLSALLQLLAKKHIPHRVIDLGGSAVRTRDVLDRVDVDPEGIVKTILFKGKKTGVFAVSVFGVDRISYAKLREILDDKVSTLRPEEMRELGWEPGECCPLNVPGQLFVDLTVFEKAKINTGSGDLRFGLEFPMSALSQIRSDIQIVDVRED